MEKVAFKKSLQSNKNKVLFFIFKSGESIRNTVVNVHTVPEVSKKITSLLYQAKATCVCVSVQSERQVQTGLVTLWGHVLVKLQSLLFVFSLLVSPSVAAY